MTKYLDRVSKLNKKYSLGFDDKKIRKVVARLETTKADFQGEKAWVDALQSISFGLDVNPLAIEAKKQAYHVNQLCPICQKPGEPVTLLGDRKAYYCQAHHTVQPVVKEE